MLVPSKWHELVRERGTIANRVVLNISWYTVVSGRSVLDALTASEMYEIPFWHLHLVGGLNVPGGEPLPSSSMSDFRDVFGIHFTVPHG